MTATPKPEFKSSPLNVLQTPFCGELRSKKFYMRDGIASTEEDYYDSTGLTWCYHTQMALGPDGKDAYPEACGPNRSCYRSAVAQPIEYAYLPNTRVNGSRIA